MNNQSSPTHIWSQRLLSIMRIAVALLFMQHGSQKLFGIPPSEHPAPAVLLSLMGAAGILEFFGGLLVLIGWFTRPVTFILSGHMAVAYFMVHAQRGFWTLQNGGESAALFCFVFLYFSFA